MNCTKCGKDLRIAAEQIGVNKGQPVFKDFGYCDTCMIKYDVPQSQNQKPKNKIVDNTVAAVGGFFGDKITKQKDKLTALTTGRIKEAECSKDASVMLQITFGFQDLGIKNISTIRQKPTGEVYFNTDESRTFSLLSYDWGGPRFQTVRNASTSDTSMSSTKKKGKGLKVGAGALIGSVAGPVGVAVGATMGALSKGKSRTTTDANSSTTEITQNIEEDTIASIQLLEHRTGRTYTFSFLNNTRIDSMLRCLKVTSPHAPAAGTPQSITNQEVPDIADQILKLKELMDMGLLSVDEFEAKKRQLLGI